MSSAALRSLGTLPVAQFMKQYWQRKPLVIRQAFALAPPDSPPIDWPGVIALAARDDVESRLISRRQGQWRLTHGPFERLPAATRKQWTLLVQGVDLYCEPVYRLLQRFRFVSDARLDDVMVSIASDGGGVGPHWDSYDVFLLQAQGRRRWRIGPTGYPSRPPDTIDALPVKIIAAPVFTEEHLLDAGDMLYLPPGWAHDGVAVGACTTLSIGYRSPTREELLQAWFADQADRLQAGTARYRDAGEAATSNPGRLSERLNRELSTWIRDATPKQTDIERFIGAYLTEPKQQVWFLPPDEPRSRHAFLQLIRRSGVQLNRQTRMLYRNSRLFINGERAEVPCSVELRQLVNDRHLSGVTLAKALRNVRVADSLHQWWLRGWIDCCESERKA